MVTRIIELPKYVISVKRKSFSVYYFQVPKRLRPESWPGSIRLGRDDEVALTAIIEKAKFLKIKMDREKRDNEKGIVRGPTPGTFPDVIKKYKKSEYWTGLKPITQKGYDRHITIIEEWSKRAKHPHVGTIQAKHIYALLSKYTDRPRDRQYLKVVLGILLNIAVIEGYVDFNVVKTITLSRRKPSDYKIVPWDDEEVASFIKKANEMGSPSIGRAVLIAYDIGQRKTDVLGMETPRDYADGKFLFAQSKTGKVVPIPATEWLQTALKDIREGLLCACEGTGRRWHDTHFSHRFREIANAAGLPTHIFKQLRHAHLINLERAGCSDKERNSHSGHSRASGNALMDKSYGLQRDAELAVSAAEKYERFRQEKGFKKQGGSLKVY